jgi:hypothetical protein
VVGFLGGVRGLEEGKMLKKNNYVRLTKAGGSCYV